MVRPTNGGRCFYAFVCLFLMCLQRSSALSLNLFRDPFDVTPYAQQVAAPNLCDLLFRVAAPHELERHVERFCRAIPALDPAAAIEVLCDANVIDAD